MFYRSVIAQHVYIRALALAEARGLINVDELLDELDIPRLEDEQ